MDRRKPDVTLKGSDVVLANSDGAYLWKRGKRVLYCGSSTAALRRIAGHNLIDKIERVLPNDIFEIWVTKEGENSLALELELIREFAPKYNTVHVPGAPRWIKCPMCRKKFKQHRWWQKYCSAICRQGRRKSVCAVIPEGSTTT